MLKRLGADRDSFVREVVGAVDGFLTVHEAAYLYELGGAGAASGAVVEIGSYHGKSTVLLATASRDAGRERVVAIDPFRGGRSPVFQANLARYGVTEWVEPIVARSHDVARTWNAPVRLLWIDGDHSADGVRGDFELWFPHVVDGGVIAFHDTFQWDGVREVVEHEVLGVRGLPVIGQVDSLLAVQKRLGSAGGGASATPPCEQAVESTGWTAGEACRAIFVAA